MSPVAGAVLVAHQPAYLPWCGYFSRLTDVDELVLLDHVQFAERGWQHRNLVRGPDADHPVRLSVPIARRGRFGQPIREAELAPGTTWAAAHWRTLTQTYAKAPYWQAHAGRLQEIYARPWTHLAPLATELIRFLLDGFGLTVDLATSSELRPAGARTAMLVELCRARAASTLRTGAGALDYLDRELLAGAGIALEVATYTHPAYGTERRGWRPGLSALDLLLHEGPDAGQILRAGARHERSILR